MTRGGSAAALFLALAFLVFPPLAPASSAQDRSEQLTAAPAALDADTAEEFFERRVPELLEDQGVPGAVVSVVAGGETLLAEGYGYADLDAEEPADGKETRFLTASLTKTFTAAAVLQLLDGGRVDLHADVNGYLPADAAVADTYPGQPVTLHHLLTHSAGLEAPEWRIGTADPADVLSLPEYVRDIQAERLYPPGRFTAYSNYGYALAGLVVEEVSGQPFDHYVHEHILSPLGMDSSGIVQPSDAQEQLGAATQYHWVDGENQPARSDYGLNNTPTGGLYATAGDFARFMLAHLGGGELEGQRVLSADSAAAMREPQFSAAPGMAGSGYGCGS